MAEKEFTCPVAGTLSMIGGKYKSIILYHLMKETLRYSELQQLRELEKDGLIRRTVYPVVPPKTEYSLTDFGRTLAPIIEAMQQWGQTHLNIAGCEERGATGTRYK